MGVSREKVAFKYSNQRKTRIYTIKTNQISLYLDLLMQRRAVLFKIVVDR